MLCVNTTCLLDIHTVFYTECKGPYFIIYYTINKKKSNKIT